MSTRPPASSPIDLDLLDRYVTGECSAAESRQVEQWLSEDSTRAGVVQGMRELRLTSVPQRTASTSPGDAWTRFSATYLHDTTTAPASPRQRTASEMVRMPATHTRRVGRLGIIVAGIALALTGIMVWRANPWTPTANAPNALRVFATGKGQRATVQLADGSRIVLGPDSKVRYADRFGTSGRDVYLDGEAVFTVAQRAGAPFTVHTGSVLTRVLGTTFSVRRYTRDTHTRVAVANGKVVLGLETQTRGTHVAGTGATGDRVIVSANDVGEIASDGTAQVHHVPNVTRYFAFTTGRIVFDNTPLAEAITTLERWYDVEIDADPALRTALVSGAFVDQSITEVLNSLCLSLDARYTRQGRVVHLVALPPGA